MNGKILILDDEVKIGKILQRVLAHEGYDCQATTDPAEAIAWLRREPFHVVLTDLRMPTMSGINIIEQTKQLRPECEVILMTAYATVETAVESMKKGAYDYLIKPFSNDEMKMLIQRVMETKTLRQENEQLKEALNERADFSNIVAVSKPMRDVLRRVAKVAQSEATVLLQGPSGTGKEVLATAIHAASTRRNRPLIKVNCGALTETLLESELFGHARGAFTGAVGMHRGLFEAADGGTIFLDEIGEVSPAFQVKLLRVLQQGEFQRVGDTETRRVNVRVIAATNRSLEKAIEQGTFRTDLYFRLSVAPIHIPPLSERREDIPALIDHFLLKAVKGKGEKPKSFSPEAFDLMLMYDWPGNVRELENAVEHALVMAEGETLLVEDLPQALQAFGARVSTSERPVVYDHLTLEEVERRCIVNALERSNYNCTRAARLLGVTRRTLGYRMQKFGLVNPRQAGAPGAEDEEEDFDNDEEMTPDELDR